MDFDRFPPELTTDLASSLAAPLRSLFQDAGDLMAQCTWHESCRVITLDLPPDFPTDQPLEGFIRQDEEIWHHQLKLNGQPLLYARSLVERSPGVAPRLYVIALVRSENAERFDATIGVLDALEMQGTLRLLSVPRVNQELLLRFEGQQIVGAIPLRTSEEWQTVPAVERIFSPGSLLSRLKERTEFTGLRSA